MQHEDERVRRAAQGDEQAFEELVIEHQKNVYNLCWRMSGNPDDALDLSQEAFLRAWRCLDQYQFDAAFSTWLYRLTNNVCIDFLRRRRRQQHESLTVAEDDPTGREYAIPDPAPLPEEQAEFRETSRALQTAMQALPAEYREVLQLRVIDDRSYEQIAQILDIKIGTVKSRIARARLQLKKILEAGNFFPSDSSESVTKRVDAGGGQQ